MNWPDRSQIRTLLILGRVSNLPTVWTNCLAGWWLGGAAHAGNLFLLLPGTSLLYLGGMFLNDAFDEDFDRQRRKERPIPSGQIKVAEVWRLGFGALAAGVLTLFCAGGAAGFFGLVLAGCIVLYDAVHKAVTISPWLMGLCRFCVYLIAGATAGDVNGWVIFCGAALAIYVAGLSYAARRESQPPRAGGRLLRWPFALLTAPVLLAGFLNTGPCLRGAIWVGLVLLLWIGFSLQALLENSGPNLGRIVTSLLAGITFVDWLAVAPECTRGFSLIFPLLLLATRLAQRFIPAT